MFSLLLADTPFSGLVKWAENFFYQGLSINGLRFFGYILIACGVFGAFGFLYRKFSPQTTIQFPPNWVWILGLIFGAYFALVPDPTWIFKILQNWGQSFLEVIMNVGG